MRLSVVYLTYRPGGIGLFGRSLIGQSAGYELLVIDDYPGRVERGQAQKFLLDLGLPLAYYGPSKPKSFPDTYQSLFNAMNTALIHATGDWVLFVHDFSWLTPGMLEEWMDTVAFYGTDPVLVHGIGMMYASLTNPNPVDDIHSWTNEDKLVSGEIQLPLKWKWQPSEWELFYFAASMYYLEQINGFDERADHAGVLILESMIEQAKLTGYDLLVNPGLSVNLMDHRVWEPPQTNLLEKKGQWRIPAEVNSHSGPHIWTDWSANPFNLADMRRCEKAKR